MTSPDRPRRDENQTEVDAPFPDNARHMYLCPQADWLEGYGRSGEVARPWLTNRNSKRATSVITG